MPDLYLKYSSYFLARTAKISTSHNGHLHTCRIPYRWLARVKSRIRCLGTLDQQEEGCRIPLLGDLTDATSGGGVRNDCCVMLPGYQLWWVRTITDHTGKVHGSSLSKIDMRSSKDRSCWVRNCKVHIVAHDWAGAYLAFIQATVLFLCGFK